MRARRCSGSRRRGDASALGTWRQKAPVRGTKFRFSSSAIECARAPGLVVHREEDRGARAGGVDAVGARDRQARERRARASGARREAGGRLRRVRAASECAVDPSVEYWPPSACETETAPKTAPGDCGESDGASSSHQERIASAACADTCAQVEKQTRTIELMYSTSTVFTSGFNMHARQVCVRRARGRTRTSASRTGATRSATLCSHPTKATE